MKADEWIFTSEQMPGLDEEAQSDYVFVAVKGWNDYTHVEIAYFDKYGLSSDGRCMDTPCWVNPFGGKRHAVDDVFAWMPLPSPPCG